jgi:hypothetical protein
LNSKGKSSNPAIAGKVCNYDSNYNFNPKVYSWLTKYLGCKGSLYKAIPYNICLKNIFANGHPAKNPPFKGGFNIFWDAVSLEIV